MLFSYRDVSGGVFFVPTGVLCCFSRKHVLCITFPTQFRVLIQVNYRIIASQPGSYLEVRTRNLRIFISEPSFPERLTSRLSTNPPQAARDLYHPPEEMKTGFNMVSVRLFGCTKHDGSSGKRGVSRVNARGDPW